MRYGRVAIVQSYIPQYRLPFFDRLVKALAEDGITLIVVAGEHREWATARGHPAVTAPWLRQVGDARALTFGKGGPRFYGYGTDRHWNDCDGVIMTHRGTDIDLNLELLRKRISRRRVGVWGHLSRSVKAPNPLDLAVERWQMRNSDHVFAYTQQGADVAVEAGLRTEKVTAVMNSVDVQGLVDAYHGLTDADVEHFSTMHSLVPGKVFGYIGGLDAAKRIDFLTAALDRTWAIDREIRFLVAGRGNQQDQLLPAVERGQVVMLGYGGPSLKALISRTSQALICPGRIGLVAVDSLAVGIPILTTKWDFHAPEFDYLAPGCDVLESKNDVDDFARLVVDTCNEECRMPTHAAKQYPTLDNMVQNFAAGVQQMFG